MCLITGYVCEFTAGVNYKLTEVILAGVFFCAFGGDSLAPTDHLD